MYFVTCVSVRTTLGRVMGGSNPSGIFLPEYQSKSPVKGKRPKSNIKKKGRELESAILNSHDVRKPFGNFIKSLKCSFTWESCVNLRAPPRMAACGPLVHKKLQETMQESMTHFVLTTCLRASNGSTNSMGCILWGGR